MKKLLLIVIIIVMLPVLAGCQEQEDSPTVTAGRVKNKEKNIGYKIEKIVLTKGYQSIEPKVEIIRKDSQSKLLATLGLIECSGITIDKITKSGNEINIYINKENKNIETQLAVPQVLIEIEELNTKKPENLKFNIINQNYEPITLKYSKNEILNSIYSQLKIASNTIPDVDLSRLGEKLIWNISFNGIFDRKNSNNPLINLNVQVDADTGEILSSDEEIISKYIDDGVILDYVPQKYLLYKRGKDDNQDIHNSLWMYDLETGKKKHLYSSNAPIYTAKFNPDNNKVAFIKHNEEISNLLLISVEDKKAIDITPENVKHTWLIKWQDNNNIYFVNNDTKYKSTIYNYNVENEELETAMEISKNILDFDIQDDTFLLTEFDNKNINKKIYLAKNGENIKEIDEGFKVSFLDKDKILYLKNSENKEENVLNIYQLNDEIKSVQLKSNIQSYIPISNGKLILIAKNDSNTDYTLYKYNVNSQSLEPFVNITGDKLFYDEEINTGYITLNPAIDDLDKNVIYSVNFEQLKINN